MQDGSGLYKDGGLLTSEKVRAIGKSRVGIIITPELWKVIQGIPSLVNDGTLDLRVGQILTSHEAFIKLADQPPELFKWTDNAKMLQRAALQAFNSTFSKLNTIDLINIAKAASTNLATVAIASVLTRFQIYQCIELIVQQEAMNARSAGKPYARESFAMRFVGYLSAQSPELKALIKKLTRRLKKAVKKAQEAAKEQAKGKVVKSSPSQLLEQFAKNIFNECSSEKSDNECSSEKSDDVNLMTDIILDVAQQAFSLIDQYMQTNNVDPNVADYLTSHFLDLINAHMVDRHKAMSTSTIDPIVTIATIPDAIRRACFLTYQYVKEDSANNKVDCYTANHVTLRLLNPIITYELVRKYPDESTQQLIKQQVIQVLQNLSKTPQGDQGLQTLLENTKVPDTTKETRKEELVSLLETLQEAGAEKNKDLRELIAGYTNTLTKQLRGNQAQVSSKTIKEQGTNFQQIIIGCINGVLASLNKNLKSTQLEQEGKKLQRRNDEESKKEGERLKRKAKLQGSLLKALGEEARNIIETIKDISDPVTDKNPEELTQWLNAPYNPRFSLKGKQTQQEFNGQVATIGAYTNNQEGLTELLRKLINSVYESPKHVNMHDLINLLYSIEPNSRLTILQTACSILKDKEGGLEDFSRCVIQASLAREDEGCGFMAEACYTALSQYNNSSLFKQTINTALSYWHEALTDYFKQYVTQQEGESQDNYTKRRNKLIAERTQNIAEQQKSPNLFDPLINQLRTLEGGAPEKKPSPSLLLLVSQLNALRASSQQPRAKEHLGTFFSRLMYLAIRDPQTMENNGAHEDDDIKKQLVAAYSRYLLTLQCLEEWQEQQDCMAWKLRVRIELLIAATTEPHQQSGLRKRTDSSRVLNPMSAAKALVGLVQRGRSPLTDRSDSDSRSSESEFIEDDIDSVGPPNPTE